MENKAEPPAGKGRSEVWITPPWILRALGPFDLDPCAADQQPWPTAAFARACAW